MADRASISVRFTQVTHLQRLQVWNGITGTSIQIIVVGPDAGKVAADMVSVTSHVLAALMGREQGLEPSTPALHRTQRLERLSARSIQRLEVWNGITDTYLQVEDVHLRARCRHT